MRRYGYLWARVIDFGNLRAAARRATRGAAPPGPPAAGSLAIPGCAAGSLRSPAQLPESRTYRPGPCRQFVVYEPKRRLITEPAYRDQVVHHALCGVIDPILERSHVADTYACRKGRGNQRALVRASDYARRYPYVLKADLHKFFPSIDHEVLKGLLRRKFKDRALVWLLDAILDGGPPQEPVVDYFPGDDLYTPLVWRKGLPIGSLTSQVLANFALAGLDHFVMEELRCGAYVRYCDDFLLFGREKAVLWAARDRVRDYLAALRLRLNEDRTLVVATRAGLNFLGFRVRPTHRTLLLAGKRRQRRRLRVLARAWQERELGLDRIRAAVASLIAHDRWGSTYGFRRFMLDEFSNLLVRAG